MKKHLLFLATLVLGLGQLFADNVTFSLAELRATLPSSNTKVAVPYTWKVSPYHVTATIAKQDGTEGVLSIAQTTNFKNYTITVAVAGEGKLNKVTFSGTTSKFGNATASIGTYASGTWTAEEGTSTNSVTFTTPMCHQQPLWEHPSRPLLSTTSTLTQVVSLTFTTRPT